MRTQSKDSVSAQSVDGKQGERKLKTWLKRLGFWGLVFFVVKGLLWLAIPALIAIFATD